MNVNDNARKVFENIKSNRRREDALKILDIAIDVIPDPPQVDDSKSILFGNYHYINKTNEGDMCIFGITVAKAHVTMYFAVEGLDRYNDLLKQLGKYKRGKICLYITNTNNIDLDVLKDLIKVHYQDSLKRKIELGR